MKQKMNFTKKMMITLLAGLIVGSMFIILREYLGKTSPSWITINNILFQDITQEGSEQALGLFYIIGQLFINALQLVLIPLVFTSIILAISHLQDTKKLERISWKTFRNFLSLTIIALSFATLIGYTSYQLGVFQMDVNPTITIQEGVQSNNPLLLFATLIPNNILSAFSNNNAIIEVVTLSIIIGLCVNFLGDKVATFKKIISEVNQITMTFLTYVITKIGPFAIFALLVRTFASYGIEYLRPAGVYLAITVPALLFFLIVILPLYVKLTTNLNPFIFIKKTMQIALFGFSTSSSAATLPLNSKVSIENLGVHEDIVAFVIPLGSAMNKTGTAIMEVLATFFIAGVAGYTITPITLVIILLLALIASISTPAIPGAGAIILFTILSSVGFTNEIALVVYSIILAINRPVEMLVTAVNVIDDTVGAVCIGKSEKLLDEKTYNSMDKNTKHTTSKK